MKKFVRFAALGLLLSIFGCAHHRSGHHIKSGPRDTWKSIAQKYGVPLWKLKAFNAKHRYPRNRWIFVPLKRGLLGSGNVTSLSRAMFDSGMFAWPVPSSKRVSSRFGKRWGRQHQGIDIPAPAGTPIVAAASGVVVYSGNDLGGYGNLTVLAHKHGFFTVYAHAQKNFTRRGEKIRRGQMIATMGKTGRSTGVHLHFEIRYNSEALNPGQFAAFQRR